MMLKTLNKAGIGYRLGVSSSGLTGAMTDAFNVTASSSAIPSPAIPPPTIIGEHVLINRKTNKKGKPIGKPVLVGFVIDFDTAMNPATVGNAADCQIEARVMKRVKRKRTQVPQRVAFRSTYDPSKNSVNLTLVGKQTFAAGGQITLISSPPSGISSAQGIFLDGNKDGVPGDNATFKILPNAKGISRT